MFKRYKGQFLTIPNILGYIRIFLMLIFVIVYFNAGNYHFAAVIFLISGLTDFLDGKIARHFHMETEFGEILDPVADKLTQGAVVLSLTFRFVMMRYLLMLILLKDVWELQVLSFTNVARKWTVPSGMVNSTPLLCILPF